MILRLFHDHAAATDEPFAAGLRTDVELRREGWIVEK
jgi:hypothetical protein